MPGIQKEKETTIKYVELEIKEEPVIEKTVTPNPQDSVPEEITVHEQVGEESTASNPIIVSESVIRRSTWNKQKPDKYSYNLTMASTELQDPSSVAEANPLLTKTSGKRPWKEKWNHFIQMRSGS